MESGYLDSEKFESKNISDKNLVLTKIVNGTSPHRRKSGRCVCNKEQKTRISASKTSKQRLLQMNKNWCYLYKLVGISALHFTYICGPACKLRVKKAQRLAPLKHTGEDIFRKGASSPTFLISPLLTHLGVSLRFGRE